MDADAFALDVDLAGDATGPRAEDAHQEFATARAHKARDAEHLAAPNLEADVPDQKLAAHVRVFDGHVSNLEGHFAALMYGFREDVADLSTDHARDDARLVERDGRVRADGATVAQDRDAVGDSEDLVELMRDVDHADAARAQFVNYAEESFDLGVCERGGRLVQHEYARLLRESLRYLDELLLPDAEVADGRARVEFEVQLVEKFLRAAVEFFPAYDAEAARLSTEEDVLADGEALDERKLLEDYGDACVLGVADARELPHLSVNHHLAAVRAERIDAAQDFHQR